MQETSDGKIVAQERYASRLPGIVARQDYLSEFYPGLRRAHDKIVIEITGLL